MRWLFGGDCHPAHEQNAKMGILPETLDEVAIQPWETGDRLPMTLGHIEGNQERNAVTTHMCATAELTRTPLAHH